MFFVLSLHYKKNKKSNNNLKQKKMTRKDYTKGQTIIYQKEIMFKGVQTLTAKIVAIGRNTLLLDNGDEIIVF